MGQWSAFDWGYDWAGEIKASIECHLAILSCTFPMGSIFWAKILIYTLVWVDLIWDQGPASCLKVLMIEMEYFPRHHARTCSCSLSCGQIGFHLFSSIPAAKVRSKAWKKLLHGMLQMGTDSSASVDLPLSLRRVRVLTAELEGRDGWTLCSQCWGPCSRTMSRKVGALAHGWIIWDTYGYI